MYRLIVPLVAVATVAIGAWRGMRRLAERSSRWSKARWIRTWSMNERIVLYSKVTYGNDSYYSFFKFRFPKIFAGVYKEKLLFGMNKAHNPSWNDMCELWFDFVPYVPDSCIEDCPTRLGYTQIKKKHDFNTLARRMGINTTQLSNLIRTMYMDLFHRMESEGKIKADLVL